MIYLQNDPDETLEVIHTFSTLDEAISFSISEYGAQIEYLALKFSKCLHLPNIFLTLYWNISKFILESLLNI